jgi:hypothetical protein
LLVAVANATGLFLIGSDPADPRVVAPGIALFFGAVLLAGYALRDWIDRFKEAIEQARLRGTGYLLYVLAALAALGMVFGGEQGMALARALLLLLLSQQLIQAVDSRSRGRAMIVAMLMAGPSAARGGPVAVVTVGVTLVGVALFCVGHHHELIRDAYRLVRAPEPRGQLVSGLVSAGLMVVWCAVCFGLTGMPAGVAPRAGPEVSQAVQQADAEALAWSIGFLAVAAATMGWLLKRERRTRERGEKSEEVLPARPTRIEPIPPAWRPPPVWGSARRRVIERYLRLLEFLGSRGHRRAPHVTPREFARRLDQAPLEEATEVFYRARYSSQPVEEADVARVEAAAARLRGEA